MYYAPQSWLADWSALTDALTKGEVDEMRGVYERKLYTLTCQECGAEFTAKIITAKYCPSCKRSKHKECDRSYHANMRMRREDVPDVPAFDYDTEAEKIKKTAPIETVLVPKKENEEMDLKTFPSLSNRTEHPENFEQPTDTTVPAAESVTIHMDGTDGITPDEKMTINSLLQEITSDRKRMLLGLYDGMCDLCQASDMTFAEMLDRMSRLHAALS